MGEGAHKVKLEKVVFISPMYNAESHLKDLVDSTKEQTNNNSRRNIKRNSIKSYHETYCWFISWTKWIKSLETVSF